MQMSYKKLYILVYSVMGTKTVGIKQLGVFRQEVEYCSNCESIH